MTVQPNDPMGGVQPGDHVRVEAIPVAALAPAFQRAFLAACESGEIPAKSGEAVIVGYRGADPDGTKVYWAVAAP